jgi:hypothetical protein
MGRRSGDPTLGPDQEPPWLVSRSACPRLPARGLVSQFAGPRAGTCRARLMAATRSIEPNQPRESVKGHPHGKARSSYPGQAQRVGQAPSSTGPQRRFRRMDLDRHRGPPAPPLSGMLTHPRRSCSRRPATMLRRAWPARTETGPWSRGQRPRDLASRHSPNADPLLNSGSTIAAVVGGWAVAQEADLPSRLAGKGLEWDESEGR